MTLLIYLDKEYSNIVALVATLSKRKQTHLPLQVSARLNHHDEQMTESNIGLASAREVLLINETNYFKQIS